MLVYIIHLIQLPLASTTDTSNETQSKQNKLLETFEKLKVSFLKTKVERQKTIDSFDYLFRIILDVNKIPYQEPHPKIEDVSLKDSKDENAANQSSKHLDIVADKLRKIFFTCLISFYRKFFYRVERIKQIEIEKGNYLNEKDFDKFSHEMQALPEFLRDNNIDISSLIPMKNEDFSFFFFLNRLEEFVCFWAKVPKEKLRKLLYSFADAKTSLDVTSDRYIREFYYNINCFLKHYNHQTYILNKAKSLNYAIIERYVPPFILENSNLGIINKYFKIYLEIDIVDDEEEARTYTNTSEDFRFKQYIEHMQVFKRCCYKESKIYCIHFALNIRKL
ncbi:hypothetical protein CDIK_1983 [Cucumispora dikerogammari]|nr:hypothetical protein CDIK_1983 [Cucumispora dikerogammari]